MTEPTNIVILGVGLAGSACVQALNSLTKKLSGATVDITVVDTRNASILKYAGTRSCVLGDRFAYRACIPNSAMIPAGRGRVINKGIKQVVPQSKEVVLEDETRLKYDYLVCATGAVNVSPCEPPLGRRTVQEMVSFYQQISTAVNQAQRILILGSGAVGTELAGEVKFHHPTKTVAILSPGKTLADGCYPPPNAKFYSKLQGLAGKLGIQLYLEQKAQNLALSDFNGEPYLAGTRVVQTTTGQMIETDLILLCTGKKLNNDMYPQEWLVTGGNIGVTDTLQVKTDPYVYAIGDINNVEENKQGYVAQQHGKLVAENLVQIIKGRSNRVKPYKVLGKTQIIVPIGRKLGASYLNGIILGSFFTNKIKGEDLFVKQHWALYDQKKMLIAEGDPNWLAKAEATYPAPGRPGIGAANAQENIDGFFVPNLTPNFQGELTMGGNKSPQMAAMTNDQQMDKRFSYHDVMDAAAQGKFSTEQYKDIGLTQNGTVNPKQLKMQTSPSQQQQMMTPQMQQMQIMNIENGEQQVKPKKNKKKKKSSMVENNSPRPELVQVSPSSVMGGPGEKKKKKKKKHKNKDRDMKIDTMKPLPPNGNPM